MSRVADGSTVEVPAQRGAATARRLLGETAAYKGELRLALGLIVVSAAAQAAVPWLVSRAIDGDILNGDAPGLARTLTGLLAVYAVGTLASRAQIFQVGSVGHQAFNTHPPGVRGGRSHLSDASRDCLVRLRRSRPVSCSPVPDPGAVNHLDLVTTTHHTYEENHVVSGQRMPANPRERR